MDPNPKYTNGQSLERGQVIESHTSVFPHLH